MESQFYAGRAGALQTRWGQPVRIDHVGGEFVVRSGRVWITRRGDPDDHVIGAGQRMVLEPAEGVVIEQWHRDQPALIDWRPQHAAPRQLRRVAGFARGVAARALCGVAFSAAASARGLRRVEAGFAALARSAAAMARRAQGCICAGDSIASAGTVQ
ncbi:DUF2917 domain-containing protein [Piscinibacter sp.]|uniref:DUF2917 domain-containing protein n=1 Tax=Piscinibacter sp. TaxID=1903157 RepID=UPI002F41B90F